MSDILDPSERRFLLKKLWCHGQLFAPVQGILIMVWGVKELQGFNLFYAISASFLLATWSYLSWRSMNSKWPHPSILLRAGAVLLLYYLGIVCISSTKAGSSTIALIVLLFTILQIIETGAYLLMVYFLIDSLYEHQQLNDQYLVDDISQSDNIV